MNSRAFRTWRLSQSSRQIARAVNDSFGIKHGAVVLIENQVFVEWSLGGPASKVAQLRRGEKGAASDIGNLRQPREGSGNGAQITFGDFPARLPIVPRRVVFQVSEEPFGALDAQTHAPRRSRTRFAISSRSAGVHSACGPRTASSSIVSNVCMSPPNSRGSTRSSFATSPPRTSSTGDPDCASSNISSRRDGASAREILFTSRVCQPSRRNSSHPTQSHS